MEKHEYIPEELTTPTLDIPESLYSRENEFSSKTQFVVNWDSV